MRAHAVVFVPIILLLLFQILTFKMQLDFSLFESTVLPLLHPILSLVELFSLHSLAEHTVHISYLLWLMIVLVFLFRFWSIFPH